MNLKIKLCGLKDKKSILAASDANYIGFVFYQKSPRFINAIQAKKLRHYIKKNQKLVGLFVNADLNLINYITDFLNLDIIQLHGDEDLKYIKQIRKLKKPIIKAIPYFKNKLLTNNLDNLFGAEETVSIDGEECLVVEMLSKSKLK